MPNLENKCFGTNLSMSRSDSTPTEINDLFSILKNSLLTQSCTKLANHVSRYVDIFRHCFIGVGTFFQPEIVSLLSLSIVLVSHGL